MISLILPWLEPMIAILCLSDIKLALLRLAKVCDKLLF